MKKLSNVGANIKAIRLEKGITQEVLASALHLDAAVISNLEKGKRDLKVKELETIAKCLGEDDILYLLTYPRRYVDAANVKTSEYKNLLRLRLVEKSEIICFIWQWNEMETML